MLTSRRSFISKLAATVAVAPLAASVARDRVGMTVGYYSSRKDLEFVLARARLLGVDQMALYCSAIPGFEQNGTLKRLQLEEVLNRLQDGGVQVPAFLKWFGRDPDLVLRPKAHRREIDSMLETIAAMGEVGVDTLLHYVDLAQPEDEALDEPMWEGLIAIFQELVDQAESSGVKLANHGIWMGVPDDLRSAAVEAGIRYENYRNYRVDGWRGPFLVRHIRQVSRLVAAVPSPSNGVCLCTGMYITGADPEEEVLRFANRIHLVQIRDVIGRWPHSQEVFPGAGDVNLSEVFRRLVRIGFAGFVHPEHLGRPRVPGEDLERAAVEYTRKMVDEALKEG